MSRRGSLGDRLRSSSRLALKYRAVEDRGEQDELLLPLCCMGQGLSDGDAEGQLLHQPLKHRERRQLCC